MGKIEKNSVKYLILEIVAISVAGIILWPLFDFLYHSFITHSQFNYSVIEHIVEPIVFGCIAGLVFWLFERNKTK